MERLSTPSLAVKFTGNASEYFRIWIVNLSLSILTLGVYSAWAKVRKQRYFYGHTRLGAFSFDYLADPVVILKGRLIAFAVFAAYSYAAGLSPVLNGAALLLLLIGTPWLVVRSLRFKARNSAYRGLRFDFRAGFRDAAGPYLLLLLLLPLTLGLAYPYVIAKQKKFMYDGFRYGRTPFRLDADVQAFYGLFLKVSGIAAGLAGATIPVFAYGLSHWGTGLAQGAPAPDGAGNPLPFLALGYVFAALASFTLTSYLQAGMNNLIWNSVSLGPHRFRSELRFASLLWINTSNALAILLSLGFLYPWAAIRSMRYRLDHLYVLPAGDLEAFVAGEVEAVRATGEELTEFLDVDLGL